MRVTGEVAAHEVGEDEERYRTIWLPNENGTELVKQVRPLLFWQQPGNHPPSFG